MRRALSTAGSILCLTVATGLSQVHENIGPGDRDKEPKITKSPSGRYSLIQKETDPPLKCCGEDAVRMNIPCYQTTVHFEDKSKPDKILGPVGLSDKTAYQAAADYIISPDEHWIVRDQHIFAGWNVLVLYKIESDGHVREVEGHLRDLGLKCVLAELRRTKKEWANVSLKDFDHVSAENASWNRTSDIVHFDVFARPDPINPRLRALRPIIDGWGVDYDLKKRSVILKRNER